MKDLIYSLFGIFFGIVLVKSDVVNWFRIEAMFNFREAHMYLVIGSAVAVGALSVFILKAVSSKPGKVQYNFQEKPYQKGFIYGGIIFGFGWAITGACPGPIYAQIGAGELPAIITLTGALSGAYLYHRVKGKLPH